MDNYGSLFTEYFANFIEQCHIRTSLLNILFNPFFTRASREIPRVQHRPGNLCNTGRFNGFEELLVIVRTFFSAEMGVRLDKAGTLFICVGFDFSDAVAPGFRRVKGVAESVIYIVEIEVAEAALDGTIDELLICVFLFGSLPKNLYLILTRSSHWPAAGG